MEKSKELVSKIMAKVDECMFIYKNLPLNSETISSPMNQLFSFFEEVFGNDIQDDVEYYSYSWPRITFKINNVVSDVKLLISVYLLSSRKYDGAVAYFGYEDEHFAHVECSNMTDIVEKAVQFKDGVVPRLTVGNKYYCVENRTPFLEHSECIHGIFGLSEFVTKNGGSFENEESYVDDFFERFERAFDKKQKKNVEKILRFLYKRWFRVLFEKVVYNEEHPEYLEFVFKKLKTSTDGIIELIYYIDKSDKPWSLFIRNTDDTTTIIPISCERELELKMNYHFGNYTFK